MKPDPISPARRFRNSAGLAAVALAVSAVGCASQNTHRPGVAVDKPIEQQTLAEIRPPVTLAKPEATPDGPASPDALQAYAQGRDALLRNQKPEAIKFFTQAVEIDPASALVWRDLGYAQIGRDDAQAEVAFRRASGLDPTDADSRLQLARLLLADDKTDAAVIELRTARLSPDFADNGGVAAVVDLLLGQSLEQAHYRTAALECYENVLKIVGDEGLALRNRPELADVLQRPGILKLRVADLATQCGQYDRAITLYHELQQQEPQSAGMIELRLARAELARGNRVDAAKLAYGVVVDAKASTLTLALYDELYESYGGPAAALSDYDTLIHSTDDTGRLLRAHLQLAAGKPAAAIDTLSKIKTVDLPLIRMTVHAYRGAGKTDALLNELLARAIERPDKWPVIERGWAILTQTGQPNPLRPEQLMAAPINPAYADARAYAVARLYEGRGRQTAAAKARALIGHPAATSSATQRADASTPDLGFDAQAADTAVPKELINADDISSGQGLAVVLDAYRDDPDLLTDVVASVIRSTGQKRMILDAFAAVFAERPSDVVIASTYAQVLNANDQRSDAAGVLDKAVGGVKSANELYVIAGQYSTIGDDKSAERILRRSYQLDPSLASTCNDLGYLLTDQGRELEFAEQLLTTAVTAEPDNAAYLDSLGWLLYKRSKFEEAAKRLDDAVYASKPVDAVVLDHAGDAHYRLKDAATAEKRWQAAVDVVKERGANDPQLRLRLEQKLRQLKDKANVVVAPVAEVK